MPLLHALAHALLLAPGMAWQVAWSLILGFTLSAAVQALVSKERMQRALGRDGVGEIALAAGFGAASSSCSYAAAAMSKTLFKKGAALIPSLAFLFASTNLVVELGIVLWLLLGWQFTAAEWIGGLVLIAILALLIKLTYPRALVEAARAHVDEATGHDHGSMEGEGTSLFARLRSPATRVAISQNFAMDVGMLWKDLAAGFLIAGALAAFVPDTGWKALFLTSAPPLLQAVENALAGPAIAVLSFVCSIGNVPLAAVLWSSGISFGGVLAFLYADLIVLPLLDIYRRYYGVPMMLYIFGVFFVTIVLSALVMDAAFSAVHLVPRPNPAAQAALTSFSLDATFWLNVGFGAVAVYLWIVDARHPMDHGAHAEHATHGAQAHAAPEADPLTASRTGR
ncbi:MAG: permease [Candidatus Eremiobacteraeota bacterium]|nr:permease [Candidatus Eremiobacteraeota bacterium]